MIYLYRTTEEKLKTGDAQRIIEEAGDTVMSAHFIGGRDWGLICSRGGTPSGLLELTPTELGNVIEGAVLNALERHDRKTARHRR